MFKSLVSQLTCYVISNKSIHDSNLRLQLLNAKKNKKKQKKNKQNKTKTKTKTVLACSRV